MPGILLASAICLEVRRRETYPLQSERYRWRLHGGQAAPPGYCGDSFLFELADIEGYHCPGPNEAAAPAVATVGLYDQMRDRHARPLYELGNRTKYLARTALGAYTLTELYRPSRRRVWERDKAACRGVDEAARLGTPDDVRFVFWKINV